MIVNLDAFPPDGAGQQIVDDKQLDAKAEHLGLVIADVMDVEGATSSSKSPNPAGVELLKCAGNS